MAKPIMIQGTASGVGKTILAMALCRIFSQDGYKVAPFKSQNITSNTAFSKAGEEIAVSQILQARAAGIEPDANMNPVILKPSLEKQATQVILKGRPYAELNAHNYSEVKQKLIPEITGAYTALSGLYDVIVIEGAGSPAELNLNHDDVANMGIAKTANAPVLLAADIDRGGVFAALYGTINLLGETERRHIKATIVNRFRGDVSLFADGARILEKITGLPVAGVIPYISFDIPDEDSLCDSGSSPYSPDRNFDSQFDILAEQVRTSLDMDLVYSILNNGGRA
ncbi:MAG: cobyric acid synthase [Spirochaetes bacterium]|nr:cobyric acid synthase [Spirochaetota bacterium]